MRYAHATQGRRSCRRLNASAAKAVGIASLPRTSVGNQQMLPQAAFSQAICNCGPTSGFGRRRSREFGSSGITAWWLVVRRRVLLLVSRLNEVRPNLAAVGIAITTHRDGRHRVISIQKAPANGVTVVPDDEPFDLANLPDDDMEDEPRQPSLAASLGELP